jgi:hypothetical protein
MNVHDHTTHTTRFRHADGTAIDLSTTKLTLEDLYISFRGPLPIHEAFTKGLLPHDLDNIPTCFEPGVEWGAAMTRNIPAPGWAGVRIGTSAAGTGMDTRKAKKTKPTHASMCALRNMMGKSSGSPKRWM